MDTVRRFRTSDTPLSAAVSESTLTQGNLFADGVLLCDGAMGTMLCDRGIPLERCYDALNLSQPETVASIHDEYLEAGAEIVETNTFGANRFRLDRQGLRAHVTEINRAGVKIARQCLARFSEPNQACRRYVAGAVGPLGVRLQPHGLIALREARAAFAEQMCALAEGGQGIGADLLMIETMTSLTEATEAVHAAREAAPGLPLVVMMTVDHLGTCLDGTSVETAAIQLTALGVQAVGCNCSHGPEVVLGVIRRMRTVTHLPLAAMPNAGLPRTEDGRNLYPVTPRDMARFAREAVQAGAGLIGGCCGTTPFHTRAMMRPFGSEDRRPRRRLG